MKELKLGLIFQLIDDLVKVGDLWVLFEGGVSVWECCGWIWLGGLIFISVKTQIHGVIDGRLFVVSGLRELDKWPLIPLSSPPSLRTFAWHLPVISSSSLVENLVKECIVSILNILNSVERKLLFTENSMHELSSHIKYCTLWKGNSVVRKDSALPTWFRSRGCVAYTCMLQRSMTSTL